VKYSIMVFLALAVISGCDNGSGPSPEPGIYGWVVGNNTGDTPIILKTDNGNEWSFQGTDLVLPENSLSSISVVDSTTAWLAGGYSEGFGIILKTTDGGETWLRMGNEMSIPNGTLCIKAFSSDVAWVGAADNAIYRTTDGGSTWADMADPGYDGYTWQGINAASPSGIWLVGGNGLQGAIIHSIDGGILWTSHGESLIDSLPMISVAAYDQQNIWAVGHGFTIVKSTDGGVEWELVTPDSLQASGNDANGITLLSPTDAWVALDYGNIWRTADGGSTWEYQTVPSGCGGFFLLRITATDPNTAWVTGGSAYGSPEGIILHTTDGGTTWTRQDDGTMPFLWDVGFAGEYN
jgi:photosystem II stability/assembly factor-like uncharacterized protein